MGECLEEGIVWGNVQKRGKYGEMFKKGDSMGKCLEKGIVWGNVQKRGQYGKCLEKGIVWEMFRKGDSMGKCLEKRIVWGNVQKSKGEMFIKGGEQGRGGSGIKENFNKNTWELYRVIPKE